MAPVPSVRQRLVLDRLKPVISIIDMHDAFVEKLMADADAYGDVKSSFIVKPRFEAAIGHVFLWSEFDNKIDAVAANAIGSLFKNDIRWLSARFREVLSDEITGDLLMDFNEITQALEVPEAAEIFHTDGEGRIKNVDDRLLSLFEGMALVDGRPGTKSLKDRHEGMRLRLENLISIIFRWADLFDKKLDDEVLDALKALFFYEERWICAAIRKDCKLSKKELLELDNIEKQLLELEIHAPSSSKKKKKNKKKKKSGQDESTLEPQVVYQIGRAVSGDDDLRFNRDRIVYDRLDPLFSVIGQLDGLMTRALVPSGTLKNRQQRIMPRLNQVIRSLFAWAIDFHEEVDSAVLNSVQVFFMHEEQWICDGIRQQCILSDELLHELDDIEQKLGGLQRGLITEDHSSNPSLLKDEKETYKG